MKCANEKCGNDFYPTTYNRRFCSRRCRKAFHSRLERDRERGMIEENFARREQSPEERAYHLRGADALLNTKPAGEELTNVLQDLGFTSKKDETK